MHWTTISYNWSTGKTSTGTIVTTDDTALALQEFRIKYPGEELLALIRGDIASSVTTYPLTYIR